MKQKPNLYRLWSVALLLALLVGLGPVSLAAEGSAAAGPVQQENDDWWSTVEVDIRQSEYHVTWQEQTYLADVDASYQAPNRAQNLRTYFAAEGLIIIPRVWPEGGEAPPWRWELQLIAWGRASVLEAVPPAEIQTQDNSIAYRRGDIASEQGLIEWYRNDENGLEQGFTLASPLPGGPEEEPLRLDLRIGGDLVAEIVGEGTAVEFHNPAGQDGLRYDGLRVVDATGHALPAWFSLQGTTLSLFVDDAEAVYPIQIDPTITGLSEDWDWSVMATEQGVDDYLGYAVATAGDVNGDGYSDVLIGMPRYDEGNTDEGAVFVYYGSPTGLATEVSREWQSNQDGARFGSSVAPAGDVNGDGYGDVIVGAPYWDDGQTDEGGVWVYIGSSTGLGTEPWDYQDGGQEDAQFGNAVATAGDVNGDGYSDVIVGASFYQSGESDEGRVYVWHGSSGDVFDQPHDWRAESNQEGARFGFSVAPAGDVNGDGYSDAIVGAFKYDNGETDEGAAFVWHGSANGLNEGTPGDPTNAVWMAQGNQANACLGTSVATAGDVNGDSYSDVIVGAIWYDNGQEDEGAAWVFLGSDAGLDYEWVTRKESNQAGADMGRAVGTAGDVNGDGYADIIVGAPYYNAVRVGRAWVWYGSPTGPTGSSVWSDDGEANNNSFGYAVATAGDVNGDGYADVIVGAPGTIGAGQQGYVNVYHGGPSSLGSSVGWSRDSNQAEAHFGHAVATAGDVNGDGYADIVIGTPDWDGGQANEGKVWVYHGGADGPSDTSDWSKEPNQAEALFGYAVGTAGDVNGDGYDDLIIGAPQYDASHIDEGVAFVYHGSADGLSAFSDWSRGCNQEGAQFGYAVGAAGDVNGDGYLDVIVGGPSWSNGETNEGGVWAYYGSADGLPATSDWHAEIDEGGQFGYAVGTAGDVNGDGYSDVIIGAPYWDHGQSQEGGAWVYFGSSAGLEAALGWRQDGDLEGARYGTAVGTAGDVNGDGYADIIVGAPEWSNGEALEGQASVYYGAADGPSLNPDWERETNHVHAEFGCAVGTAGDVNGDGYADIVVGAKIWDSGSGETYEGSAWVYHGSAGGLHTYSDWHDESNQAWANFGHAVGTAGDVNGDGYADVLIGAPGYDNGQNDEGRTFLYYGNGSRGLSLQPRQENPDGPLAHLGQGQDSFKVCSLCRNPFGRNSVAPELEVKRLGHGFDGTATFRLLSYTPAVGGLCITTWVELGGCVEPDGNHYHWRMRWHYDPVTTPWMPAGRWFTIPWNGWNEADFRSPEAYRVFLPLVQRNLQIAP